MDIDRRPIITCAGELEVFSQLEDALSHALPQDPWEWRRSLGRPARQVRVGASFAPFSAAALPKPAQWDLVRQPLLHVYWTECADVDVYKTSVKDDVESWLRELVAREIPDWMIVVVEGCDGRRANKLLPRTTVLDRIRADFAPKQGDRCISVIRGSNQESRSADSWRGLVGRVRHLLLAAYARAVARLEDHVRQRRERRAEPDWSLAGYLALHEELAHVLASLGLHDEALIQYDELDALVSQVIADTPAAFRAPLERWHGLRLVPGRLGDEPSVLELRAHLFANQAHLLLAADKIWEVAARSLPFLHNCAGEVALLDVTMPAGALPCWLFLACMEVLQRCEAANRADQVEAYSLNTAPLWEYASRKLKELGELCGLMPGGAPTSEQLHVVVGLSAGMGDNPGAPGSPTPTDRLKEALCSQDAFNRNYLELAELATGTYKHIGRLRSARLVGLDLAAFHLLLGDAQKSAAFVADALRTFERDGWRELAAHAHVALAGCHRQAGDARRLAAECAAVAASPDADTLVRWTHHDEMLRCAAALDRPLAVTSGDAVRVLSVMIRNAIEGPIAQGTDYDVEVVLESGFPREVVCRRVAVSLEADGRERRTKEKGNAAAAGDRRLRMHRHIDYKQDGQIASASVVCGTAEGRREGCATTQQSQRADFTVALECMKLPFVLTPGANNVRLTGKAMDVGRRSLGHVAVHIGRLELISALIVPRVSVEVRRDEPTVRLDEGRWPLLLGLEQRLDLTVTVGSYAIDPDSMIKLSGSRGVTLQYLPDAPLQSSVEIPVPCVLPAQTAVVAVRVAADQFSTGHQVTVRWPYAQRPVAVALSFAAPLECRVRLHTAARRKFVQITVAAAQGTALAVSKPRLLLGDGIGVVAHNVVATTTDHVIADGIPVSYMWEVEIPAESDGGPLKGEFRLQYAAAGENCGGARTFQHYFDITDYQTLYVVEADVDPTKGNEFCRAGAVCSLRLSIRPAAAAARERGAAASLMYEVLAEQSVWAVCGRTAGVVSFVSDPEPRAVALEVMPLAGGYLPLPPIRLSKYIPAEFTVSDRVMRPETHPRLEPFGPGQVYNASKGRQVHVIAATSDVQ